MRVTTAELRKALERVLEHLEENGCSEQAFDEDYYWWVPTESAYDAYEQPSQLTLGQLSDDWDRAKAIADGRAEPLGYALVWLSTILRYIGEKNVA